MDPAVNGCRVCDYLALTLGPPRITISQNINKKRHKVVLANLYLIVHYRYGAKLWKQL